jgi:hypothetical protein
MDGAKRFPAILTPERILYSSRRQLSKILVAHTSFVARQRRRMCREVAGGKHPLLTSARKQA